LIKSRIFNHISLNSSRNGRCLGQSRIFNHISLNSYRSGRYFGQKSYFLSHLAQFF
jgi:hypothetical protein